MIIFPIQFISLTNEPNKLGSYIEVGGPWNSYPGACIIKLITAVIYGFCNKLERLPLASFFSLF